MFGVKIDSKGGPVKDSENDFDQVEQVRVSYISRVDHADALQIFTKMKAGMDNDKVEKSEYQSPGLYCGPDGWKYFAPDDDDPLVAGKKLKDRRGKSQPSEDVPL